jgi:hypothetical protein
MSTTPLHQTAIEQGEALHFSDLPFCAQQSLVQTMAVEDGAWADDINRELLPFNGRPPSDDVWRTLIDQIDKAQGDFLCFYSELPTEIVTKQLMDAHPAIRNDHNDWASYHQHYLATETIPDHARTSRWPCIATEGSSLADGWKRLHCYVRANDLTIPFVVLAPAHAP